MNKLTPEDAAYLSGLFEKSSVSVSHPTNGNPSAVKFQFNGTDEQRDLVKTILGIDAVEIEKKAGTKITHCRTGSTCIIPKRNRTLFLHYNEMLELLPQLSFKTKLREALRIEALDALKRLKKQSIKT
jgi:hypothetical protein